MRRLITIVPATIVALILGTGSTLACGGLVGRTATSNLAGRRRWPPTRTGSSATSRRSSSPAAAKVRLDRAAAGRADGGRQARRLDVPAAGCGRRAPASSALGRRAVPASAAASRGRPRAQDRGAQHNGPEGRRGRGRDLGDRTTASCFARLPEVLEFYADRSPNFMAASFNLGRLEASGQTRGDGTPIILTIPTPRPVGTAAYPASARLRPSASKTDVFLLTERAPAMLPVPVGAEAATSGHSDGRRPTSCSTTSAPTVAWSGCRSPRG